MIETTTFSDQGRTTIREDGLQVVQVYEGEGTQTFADQFKKQIWYTEVMIDILKRDGYKDSVGGWSLTSLRKAIQMGDRTSVLSDIGSIRQNVKAQFRDPLGDPRQSAMVAHQEWKIAFNEH